MSSSGLKKSVLVDSMEYDRLRQRQLRDYQPELSKLGQLQDHINRILNNRKLGDHEKLEMLGEPQAQFDRLRSELGVLSGAVREGSDGPDNVNVSVGPPSSKKSKDTDGAAADDDDDEEARQALPRGNNLMDWEDLKIPNTSARKAKRLLVRIGEHPDVIRANQDGELVVNGEAVPFSNFTQLVRTLFTNRRAIGPHMTGMNELFAGMRQLRIHPDNISSKAMRALYNPQPVVTAAPAAMGHELGITPRGEVLRNETPKRQEIRSLIRDNSAQPQRHGREMVQKGKGGIFSKGHKAKNNVKYVRLKEGPLEPEPERQVNEDDVDPVLDLHVRRPPKQAPQKGHGHPPGVSPHVLYVY